MARFIQTKRHPHKFLLYLLVLLPFLFGIAYMIGFNQKAHAALITRDTTSSGTTGSWSFTTNVSPTSNSILVVGISGNPSSVKYGTQALTKAVQASSPSPTNYSTIWYLVAPTKGTATITSSGSYSGVAATFYNVDQTTPIGKTASSIQGPAQCEDSPIGLSTSVSSTTTSQIVLDFLTIDFTKGSSTFNPGSGQSLVVSGKRMSQKTGAAGSTGMSWSTSCGSEVDYVAALTAISLNEGDPVPTETPIPTAIPTTTAAPTPTSAPASGNITGLNFGITNSAPWIQVACGDLRMDSGLTNPAPAGQNTITTNSSCTSPGVVFTGDTTASFGQGQASSTNQVVGGSLYPEVFTQSDTGGLFSSFSSLLAKAQSSGTLPTDLASICTLSNCTLPANLPHGVYLANGDVTLNAYSFPANQNYVLLINGNLTINGNVVAQTGTNSSLLIATAGNIIIPPTVGSPVSVTTANLAGIFSTDKSFIVQSNNNCTDLRLNVEGAIIVNAALNGGSLQNSRDLCGNNATSPTIALTQRLDFVLNLPDFIKQQSITSQEVAP